MKAVRIYITLGLGDRTLLERMCCRGEGNPEAVQRYGGDKPVGGPKPTSEIYQRRAFVSLLIYALACTKRSLDGRGRVAVYLAQALGRFKVSLTHLTRVLGTLSTGCWVMPGGGHGSTLMHTKCAVLFFWKSSISPSLGDGPKDVLMGFFCTV